MGNYVGREPAPAVLAEALISMMVGALMYRHSANVLFLRADGQTVAKATYPALWTYAQGFLTADQVTNPGLYRDVDASNFALPNFDGLFVRSLGGAAAAVGVKQVFNTGKPAAVPAAQTSHLTSGTAGSVSITYAGGAVILTSGWDAETRPVNAALMACIFSGKLS